ncbi:hypothetical protein Ancab_017632 [Ancistrocladus abbreviatus]
MIGLAAWRLGARLGRSKDQLGFRGVSDQDLATNRTSSTTNASLCQTAKQIKMGHSNVWNSHPKNYGPGSRTCRVCGNSHGLIRKYGLMTCRQCFRSNAKEIGFIKYR